jgi:hypothetical protein
MKAAKTASVARPPSRIHSGSARLTSTVRSTLEPRGGYTQLQQMRIQKVERETGESAPGTKRQVEFVYRLETGLR